MAEIVLASIGDVDVAMDVSLATPTTQAVLYTITSVKLIRRRTKPVLSVAQRRQTPVLTPRDLQGTVRATITMEGGEEILLALDESVESIKPHNFSPPRLSQQMPSVTLGWVDNAKKSRT